MRFLIALAVLVPLAGCHHDRPAAPTATAQHPDFSATYSVRSIRNGDYSQYIVALDRPNGVDPATGRDFAPTWMELKTFMQDDLKAALEPGTTVEIAITRKRTPAKGFICRCGSLCSARRGGICQSGCGCPIGH